MKYTVYKAFLVLLHALVYIKRALVWLFRWLVIIVSGARRLYRQHLGFRLYKFILILKHGWQRPPLSWTSRMVDLFSQRATLQIVLFIIALIIVFPNSRLYTREGELVAGRGTILYQIAGPGELDFEIEEIEINISEITPRDTRSWREGAVVNRAPSGNEAQVATRPQEIAGISAGGAAVTKPTILPGAQLPGGPAQVGQRTEVIHHLVQPGEVVSRIAAQYGVSVTTILWANSLSARSYIRPGDKLLILPVDGVRHTVRKNETVSKIAKLYEARPEDVISFNKLQAGGADIVVGEQLIIPGGKKPPPPRSIAPRSRGAFGAVAAAPPSISAPAGSLFIWPAAARHITQYYGWRHTGLDIAGPPGTPVYASRAGLVIRSQCGWNGGYGCYVIIDHGGGQQTLYGHNSHNYVAVGEEVAQGQAIAAMGSTGRSTGPHVHFEVRVGGRKYNPLRYIR